jgi:hypothetical protein
MRFDDKDRPSKSGRTEEQPAPARVIVDIDLPQTVGDVKVRSTQHTLFHYKKLADDYTFSHWCLLVPHPLSTQATDDEASASGSALLFSQRHVVGGALPDTALLVAFVTKEGGPDLALGADITRALEYDDDETPILIFTTEPRVRIHKAYRNVELLAIKDRKVDGIAVSLGGCSPEALLPVIKAIPKCFTDRTVKLDELNEKVRKAKASTVRTRQFKRAAKVSGPVVNVLLGVVGKTILGGG